MEQRNLSTNPSLDQPKRTFRHLTEADRYVIEKCLKNNLSTLEIANILGVSRRTIQYEIKRGSITQKTQNPSYKKYEDSHIYVSKYFADSAQQQCLIRQKNKGRHYKVGPHFKLVDFIESKIKEDRWSPQVVLGYIKTNGLRFETDICLQTLYNYIHNNFFCRISDKDLCDKARRKKKARPKHKRPSWKNLDGISIDQRPETINNRESFGHWEIDLVVGPKSDKHPILTLVERQSRYVCMVKLKDKTQDSVCAGLTKMKKQLCRQLKRKNAKPILSITADNGSEFLDSKALMRASGCDAIYYAHPYSSFERGSNENMNRMIRRFFPKGTCFSNVKHSELKKVEHWLNNYPRPLFNFLSANTLFGHFASLGEITF